MAKQVAIAGSEALARCQVHTPIHVTEKIWSLLAQKRDSISKVIDLGAGDGRFSIHGQYESYLGIEFDKEVEHCSNLPNRAMILHGCAFDHSRKDYDLCIGNPPYIRHHHLSNDWKEKIAAKVQKGLGISIDGRANAYIYFLAKALECTNEAGLIALLVPYEWVSRPASKTLRDYIKSKGWSVEVHRFADDIFDRVLTTASLTIIDKRASAHKCSWSFYMIDSAFNSSKMKFVSGNEEELIPYSSRKSCEAYAQRGLSPGSQKAFTLTEGERVFHGLAKFDDVIPCVTSLKRVPKSIKMLTQNAFEKYFVATGERCWLVKAHPQPTAKALEYFSGVSQDIRTNATCRLRSPWWNYPNQASPDAIFSSGFIHHGPKFFQNTIKAIPVGSACGIYNSSKICTRRLLEILRAYRFEGKVVRHAKLLHKVEVNQMNAVLSANT